MKLNSTFKWPKESTKLHRLNAWGRLIFGGLVMIFARFVASQMAYNSSMVADFQRETLIWRSMGAMMAVSGLVDLALIYIAKWRS